MKTYCKFQKSWTIIDRITSSKFYEWLICTMKNQHTLKTTASVATVESIEIITQLDSIVKPDKPVHYKTS